MYNYLERAKEWYRNKIEWLEKAGYEEVSPYDFYRDVWPSGALERKGHQEDEKPNGLALVIEQKTKADGTVKTEGRHHIITDELSEIPELIKNDMVITAPVSYIGQRRNANNARYLYGLAFDVDSVDVRQLRDLLHQGDNELIPMPTYTIISGGGVHAYYLFADPIPMYRNNQKYLRQLKHALTGYIWNPYTSKREDTEYQSIIQGFRMVGSPSKMGKEYPVRAYKTGTRTTTEELEKYLAPLDKENYGIYLTKQDTKLQQRLAQRIEENQSIGKVGGRWHIKRDLYEWWLQNIRLHGTVHHRYFCIMTLAVYAAKCDVSEEDLRRDAYSLLELFDKRTIEEDNHFTADDIEKALTAYNDDYIRFPRDVISRLTAIPIKTNRRNYRPQEEHIKIMNFLRDMKYPDKEWRGNTSKEQEVKKIIEDNPGITKKEIKDKTGISYTTIRKYYDKYSQQKENIKEDKGKCMN